MGYARYGISAELVEKVKFKLKEPLLLERTKTILKGVTKKDLQNRATIKRLIKSICSAIGVSVSDQQVSKITAFIIDQKIDPNNLFHLIKLRNMFR